MITPSGINLLHCLTLSSQKIKQINFCRINSFLFLAIVYKTGNNKVTGVGDINTDDSDTR